MATRAEKIIKYLTEDLGAEELPSNNKRYRKFSNPSPDYWDLFDERLHGGECVFWVGVRGAVRKGRNISSSISVTDKIFKKADAYFDSLKWKTVPEAQKIVQLFYVRKNLENWNIFIEFQTSITSDKEIKKISGYSPTYRALIVSSPKDSNDFPLSFIDIEISDEEMENGDLNEYCEEIVEIIQKELPENQKEKVAILHLLLRNMDTYISLKEKTFLIRQAVNEIEKVSKKIYKKDGFFRWFTPNRTQDSFIDSDSWLEICQKVGLFSKLYKEFDFILGNSIEGAREALESLEDGEDSFWIEEDFWEQSPYDENTLDEARVSIVSMLDLLVDTYIQMLKSTLAFEKVHRGYRSRKSIASDDLIHSVDRMNALFVEYFFSHHFDQDIAIACGFLLLEQFILELDSLDFSEIFEDYYLNIFEIRCCDTTQLEKKFIRNVIKKNYYD